MRISLVFTISLKGNKAASRPIYVYAELRRGDRAAPLLSAREAAQHTDPNPVLQIRQLLTVLAWLPLPHLVKAHSLGAWNFRFLILNIMYCSGSQPATQEGSVPSFQTAGLAMLLKSSESNIISIALKRSIRTGKCTALDVVKIAEAREGGQWGGGGGGRISIMSLFFFPFLTFPKPS